MEEREDNRPTAACRTAWIGGSRREVTAQQLVQLVREKPAIQARDEIRLLPLVVGVGRAIASCVDISGDI